MMPRANRAGSNRQTARPYTSAAESNHVGRGKLRQRSLLSKRIQQVFTSEPSGSETGGGTNQEFAAMHKTSREVRLTYDTPAPRGVAGNVSWFLSNKNRQNLELSCLLCASVSPW